MTAPGPVRLGLVGYGLGGRYFHAPFIAAAGGMELSPVVTRDPVRRAEVRHDWPGVPVFDTQADLLRSGLEDAVMITTPPGTRRPLVLEALAAGMHFVAGRAAGSGFEPNGSPALDGSKPDAGVPLTRANVSAPGLVAWLQGRRSWTLCGHRSKSDRP